jgi:hypothetical protein
VLGVFHRSRIVQVRGHQPRWLVARLR